MDDNGFAAGWFVVRLSGVELLQS